MSWNGQPFESIIILEFFAGLLPLVHVAENLALPIAAHFSSESDPTTCTVQQCNFPSVIQMGDIREVTNEYIIGILEQFSESLVVFGAGVPCAEVSALNQHGGGPSAGQTAMLFEFKRCANTIMTHAPKRCVGIMECTRMSGDHIKAFDNIFNVRPILICSSLFAPVTRPRLFWFSSPIEWPDDVSFTRAILWDVLHVDRRRVHVESILEDSWLPSLVAQRRVSIWNFNFKCLIQHRPKKAPMSFPRGFKECDQETLERWKSDDYAQAPYMYMENNLVSPMSARSGAHPRRLIAVEEERLQGWPTSYTAPVSQSLTEVDQVDSKRRSLIGLSWHIGVVRFIVMSMFGVSEPVQASSTASFSPASSISWHDDGIEDLKVDVRHEYDEIIGTLEHQCWLAFRACPFVQRVHEHGFENVSALGPDAAELDASTISSVASNVQAKKLGCASSGIRLLPPLLPMATHVALAGGTTTPLEKSAPLSADLEFAIDCQLRPDYFPWATKQMRTLQGIVKSAGPLHKWYDEHRTHESRVCCPQANPSAFDIIRRSIGWPDDSLPLMFTTGVSIVGKWQELGIFRNTEVEAQTSPAELLQTAPEWHDKLCGLPMPKIEAAQAIFQKSVKEQALGILGPFLSREAMDSRYGPSGYRALKRFAVWQASADDWRVIDNGLLSGTNATFETSERIHTTSLDANFAVAQQFVAKADASGAQVPKLLRFTKDMKRAYRQISRRGKHGGFSVICLWHPELGKWVFAELLGLPFGLVSAVLHFNRLPTFIVAVARRWLGIPLTHFFDDFKGTVMEANADHSWQLFGGLVTLLGSLFDPEKDVPPGTVGPFLGAVEDYSGIQSSATIVIKAKPAFLERLKELLVTIVKTRIIPPGERKSIVGRLLHLSSMLQGRVGRGQTFAISNEHEFDMDQVVDCARFHLALMQLDVHRRVNLRPWSMARITIYTDASCEPQPPPLLPKVELCYLIMHGGQRIGAHAVLDQRTIAAMREKHTYIAHGEALAVLYALVNEADRLRGCSALWLIDNMGVLSALCKGSSTVPDIGCITHAICLVTAALGLQAWYEYVPSKSNLADGGTRSRLKDAVDLGFVFKPAKLPEWPADTLKAPPEVWLEWFRRFA